MDIAWLLVILVVLAGTCVALAAVAAVLVMVFLKRPSRWRQQAMGEAPVESRSPPEDSTEDRLRPGPPSPE